MGYLKMQGGEWLVAGRCSEPKYRRVGQDNTPRCTVGIAAGKHPTEVDDKGNPKTIWINVTAWRGQADVLGKARRGDGVLVVGSMYEDEYNGEVYKGINASVVLVSQPDYPTGYAPARPTPSYGAEPLPMTELDGDDGEPPF